jgi:transposase-like protein
MIGTRGQEAESAPLQPSRCPTCNGRQIVTTSKTIDRETYWRCVSCGEVWNLDRCRSAYRGRPADRLR